MIQTSLLLGSIDFARFIEVQHNTFWHLAVAGSEAYMKHRPHEQPKIFWLFALHKEDLHPGVGHCERRAVTLVRQRCIGAKTMLR